MNFPDFKLKLNSFFTEKQSYQILFLVIVGLHLIVKFGTLNQLELQGDEAFSVFYSQQSINELLQTLNKEANPPFYYLLLHFWIQFFGIGLVAVKSLNIIISIGTAIMLFKLTKKLEIFGSLLSFLFVFYAPICILILVMKYGHSNLSFFLQLPHFIHFFYS